MSIELFSCLIFYDFFSYIRRRSTRCIQCGLMQSNAQNTQIKWKNVIQSIQKQRLYVFYSSFECILITSFEHFYDSTISFSVCVFFWTISSLLDAICSLFDYFYASFIGFCLFVCVAAATNVWCHKLFSFSIFLCLFVKSSAFFNFIASFFRFFFLYLLFGSIFFSFICLVWRQTNVTEPKRKKRRIFQTANWNDFITNE